MKNEEKVLNLKFDKAELSPAQVRLIRRIEVLMKSVINPKDEATFFEASAELMRISASLIKQSHFTEYSKQRHIPYAEQALEYSMDILQEYIQNANVVSYDN